MPSPVTSDPRRLDVCLRCGFKALYIALLFFSLHWAVVLYINSSYLEQFFSSRTVGTLYIIGAFVTLSALFTVSNIIKKLGSIRLIATLTTIEAIALLGMAFTPSPYIALVLFIIHHAVVPLILFTLDMLMESLIGNDESVTGIRRAIFLTIGSFTLALGTLVSALLIHDTTPHFAYAYMLSTALLGIFITLLYRSFRKYKDASYPQLHIRDGIRTFWEHADIRNVFFAQLLLQFFFAWMVIYTPIYLTTIIGFNWQEVGLILFFALMAYVLLDYAIGYLADTKYGEKEMMALGFAIMGISSAWFVLMHEGTFIGWVLLMFATRVGAALVETTSESYFFKHTQEKDTSVVGIFRSAQPIGYILGPILGGTLLLFFPFSFIFVMLGGLMIPGLFFAMALHDTL